MFLKRFFYTFYFIFLIFYLSSCANSKGPILNLIPEEKEIELGKIYVYAAIDEYDGLYPEKEVQDYISKIGNKLAKFSERKVPYTFYVVNSDIVNAFALPGGPVVITRGLLLNLDKESQLAGVIGHEIGHINAKHHVKMLEKQLALNLLLQIGSLLAPESLTGEALLQLGAVSASLLQLKFSRDQEREADRYGFLFTYQAGYSPQGMIEVFEKFKAMEKERPPEWLSTHPLPETRIREAKEYIKTFKPSGTFIYDTETFQKIKNLLVANQPSYKQVVKGKAEYKKKNFQAAETHFLEALKLYPKNNLALVYLASIKLEQKDFNNAKAYAIRAVVLDPNFFSAQLLAGIACFKTGEVDIALSYFEKASQLIPFHGISYYYKGRVYEAKNQLSLALQNYQKALELGPKEASWYNDCKVRYNRLRY
ncbi:M48 family metalloprotease [Thermodesulfobacterium sp. TA1]|uniref:beta-barrel assembly-enhancing protease n=1 Tax=Thermodesulfobacterium sp. TA1 TaxID=2234087 RepID=UPI0012325486|nr:M48 family metalloprotease [Thermodesulfobacterium sp. TA1]QER41816.1 M48 family metalloprotease [Thermodesulfobacterium sp. TA1]